MCEYKKFKKKSNVEVSSGSTEIIFISLDFLEFPENTFALNDGRDHQLLFSYI